MKGVEVTETGEGEAIETMAGTTAMRMAVIVMEGIGPIRIMLGIGIILFIVFLIVRVTWAPFRLLMEPKTPLLAILIHASDSILLILNHRMPEVAFNPRPAFRLEVKAGVEMLFLLPLVCKLLWYSLQVPYKCHLRGLLLDNPSITPLRIL